MAVMVMTVVMMTVVMVVLVLVFVLAGPAALLAGPALPARAAAAAAAARPTPPARGNAFFELDHSELHDATSIRLSGDNETTTALGEDRVLAGT